MDKGENVFPLDITERKPGARPWKFRPDGYLVVMLSDEGEAQRAEESLVAEGFASRDIKLYGGQKILATYNEIYKQQRDLADKVKGAVTDDIEGRDRYLDYAREGRCALWLRIPNEDLVPKALRAIADLEVLHVRHYGVGTETDYHVSEPSE